MDQLYPFKGDLSAADSTVQVSKVQVLGDYELTSALNIRDGLFNFSLIREPFRLSADFSFDNWDTLLDLKLEHADIQGSDVVTFARFRLKPTEELKRGKKWFFVGSIKTDYLVLDTEPLNDLEGTFRIEYLKVGDIDLKWGRDFTLKGVYDFLSPKESSLCLTLNSVDLAELKRIFFYQRPKVFAGIASGRIELSGSLKNPLISGNIDVANGTISKFSYKGAYLKFSGYYPFLRLSDSKIVRGKRDLHLKGDLNLKAENIFQDLQVLSEDRIVVWSGMILSESLDENLVMIGEKLKRRLTE
jgi:hypothetical protein